MSHPLVSIGMPVHNGAPLLRRALDSLRAQRWPNLEIVVSDNVSTDATPGILKAIAVEDPRVRVVRQPHKLGGMEHFVRVLQLARGEFFMWAADDDWWDPDFVPHLVRGLEENPAAAAAMCAVDRVRLRGEEVELIDQIRLDPTTHSRHWIHNVRAVLSRARYHFFIYGLWRRSFLAQAALQMRDTFLADRLLILQTALSAPLVYVDEVLHLRTMHEQDFATRRPDEVASRMLRESELLSDVRTAGNVLRVIRDSELIPPRRKLLAPLIVGRFLAWRTGVRRKAWLKRRPEVQRARTLRFLLDEARAALTRRGS